MNPAARFAKDPHPVTRQSSCRGADGEVVQREAVTGRKDIGDPGAMADLRIGLVTEQAARRRAGDFGGALQIQLGFRTGELVVDNRPEPFPIALTVGEPALGRRPERGEMDITHSCFFDRRRELSL